MRAAAEILPRRLRGSIRSEAAALLAAWLVLMQEDIDLGWSGTCGEASQTFGPINAISKEGTVFISSDEPWSCKDDLVLDRVGR